MQVEKQCQAIVFSCHFQERHTRAAPNCAMLIRRVLRPQRVARGKLVAPGELILNECGLMLFCCNGCHAGRHPGKRLDDGMKEL